MSTKPEALSVGLDALVGLSPLQDELRRKHGTPADFAAACYRAVPEFLSMSEAAHGISQYTAEWDAARASTPDDYRAELHTSDCCDERCPGCLPPNAELSRVAAKEPKHE